MISYSSNYVLWMVLILWYFVACRQWHQPLDTLRFNLDYRISFKKRSFATRNDLCLIGALITLGRPMCRTFRWFYSAKNEIIDRKLNATVLFHIRLQTQNDDKTKFMQTFVSPGFVRFIKSNRTESQTVKKER